METLVNNGTSHTQRDIGFSIPLYGEQLGDCDETYYLPILRKMAAAGCRALEINIGSLDPNGKVPEDFCKEVSDMFAVRSLHLATRTGTPDDGGLTGFGLRWARSLGASIMVLHPTPATQWQPLLDRFGAEGFQLSVENLDNLTNLEQNPNKYGYRVEQISALLRAYPGLRLVYDLSHSAIVDNDNPLMPSAADWHDLEDYIVLYHSSGTNVPNLEDHARLAQTGQFHIVQAAKLIGIPVICESLGINKGRGGNRKRNVAENWLDELIILRQNLPTRALIEAEVSVQ